MTSRLTCANPRCRIPGRHNDGCDRDNCRGCLVAWAADGSRLCVVDIKRLGDNATKCAELHGELELVLKAAGATGRATSKPGPGTPPRDAVVDMRAEIRHVLVSWCRLISEERGISLPGHLVVQRLPRGFIGPPNRVWADDDTLPAIGAYVKLHAEWLAATEYAGEAADELAELAGKAWGLAYPNGTRRVEVGPCPLCDGTLTAIVRATDGQLPSEVVCDGDESHRWPAEQWRQLDRLVTARKRAAA